MDEQQGADLPRRPVEIMGGDRGGVVSPGDPGYAQEYRLAVRLHEEGIPMPYADVEGGGDEAGE